MLRFESLAKELEKACLAEADLFELQILTRLWEARQEQTSTVILANLPTVNTNHLIFRVNFDARFQPFPAKVYRAPGPERNISATICMIVYSIKQGQHYDGKENRLSQFRKWTLRN